jgi:hypothetical protein
VARSRDRASDDRVFGPATAADVLEPPAATIVDLLDRLLDKGVMTTGDLTLGLAGVDLIYVRLSALLCAVDRVLPRPAGRGRKRPSPARRRR